MDNEARFDDTLRKLPADAATVLQSACADQPQLRAAVEALLATYETELVARENKPVRKNKGARLAAGLVVFCLVCVIGSVTYGAVKARKAQELALQAYEEAEVARTRFTLAAAVETEGRQKAENAMALTKTIELLKKQINDSPNVPAFRLDLARSYNKLGPLLQDQGKRQEAQALIEQSRAILEKLVDEFPAVPEYRQELASCHLHSGNLLVTLGKQKEAQAEYAKTKAILKKLLEAAPAKPADKLELARVHNGLGNLLRDQGKQDEARANYEVAHGILKDLVAQFPDMPAYQQELARTQDQLGKKP